MSPWFETCFLRMARGATTGNTHLHFFTLHLHFFTKLGFRSYGSERRILTLCFAVPRAVSSDVVRRRHAAGADSPSRAGALQGQRRRSRCGTRRATPALESILVSCLVVSPDEPVTELLRESRKGSAEATGRLIPVVYQHLHALASHYMRGERPGHTLTPTALLNEAYIKLAGTEIEWRDRAHFFFIASRLMRQILVDHAKTRNRQKRGAGAPRIDLEEIDVCDPRQDAAMMEIDEALTRLAQQDERKARLIELLYFGGLKYEEAAQALDISEVTVHRDLKMAKAWLRHALSSRNAP
jgi:RNA polymerase sigma factor (TIGR02999 family)